MRAAIWNLVHGYYGSMFEEGDNYSFPAPLTVHIRHGGPEI